MRRDSQRLLDGVAKQREDQMAAFHKASGGNRLGRPVVLTGTAAFAWRVAVLGGCIYFTTLLIELFL